MKYIKLTLLLCLFQVALYGQCETSNCDPTMTGMNATVECVNDESTTTIVIGWAMQLGSGEGFCSAPAGSWALKISLPDSKVYEFVSVSDVYESGGTGENGFDWTYEDQFTTLEGITNTEFVSHPVETIISSGTVTIVVRGKIPTECVKEFSNVNIRITNTGGIPPDDSDCLEAFNNDIGNDTEQTSLGVDEMDLPVELLNFRASKQGENGLLNWSTSSELNNEYFMVERSVDGISFESIGRVEGAGTTNQKQDYSFTDRKTVKGINYYRLNQFDYDGESSYSPIRTINFGDADSGDDIVINLYPNPVYDKVSITSTKDIKDHKLMVYNVIGQLMSDVAYVSGMELDMTRYEPGVYMIQIVDQEGNVLKSDRLVKL